MLHKKPLHNHSERQKIADDKNVERMIKELERTEQQYDTTLEDLAQVTILNGATREQLQSEEERTLQAEDRLRVRGLKGLVLWKNCMSYKANKYLC